MIVVTRTMFALICLLALGASLGDARAQTPEPADSTAACHIRNISQGLLVETAVNGVFTSATLQERMAYYHTPGVSVAVVNDYRIEWARGFGVQEAGTRRPVTATTRFQAGSVSKPTFAVVVMRLVERGAISLDQDVDRYLSSWKIPQVGGWQPRITLRQLLGHAAGFTVHGFLGYERKQSVPTVPQVLDGAPPANSQPVRINILPGVQYRYSGGGTTVAQLAVEDYTGSTLPALARELVFEPLAMRRSGYEQPLHESIDVATGHYSMARPLSGRWHTYPELAAAGLWTTPSDLARLGSSLQRAIRGDSGQVLTPSSAREMVTRQRIQGADIGIAFFLRGQGDSVRFEHSGWDEGFLTEFVMYVHGGRGAVVMVNSTEGEALIPEITRAIAREYAWSGYVSPPSETRPLGASLSRRYAGNYTLDDSSAVSLEDRAGTLWLAIGDQPPVQLAATSDTSFTIAGLNTTVTVSRADSANATLLIDQGGQRFQGKRRATRP